jgi:hypothetical protein
VAHRCTVPYVAKIIFFTEALEVSVTMSHESSTDLSIKYQKLATEYAKLRAQVVVLKKGVLDEQEKNTVLTEQVPSSIRRVSDPHGSSFSLPLGSGSELQNFVCAELRNLHVLFL